MDSSDTILRTLMQASPLAAEAASPVLDILIIIFLIFINGFFAATEIAVISLNDNVVKHRSEEGDRVARRLMKLIKNPSGFLATIQVGVTMAGFMASAFAADKFAGRLYLLIDPAEQYPSLYTVSVISITLILVFFTLVFGELVPKRVAQTYPEQISRAVSGVIGLLGKMLRPLVVLLSFSTNLILRMIGIDPTQTEHDVTEEEIRMMVDVGRERGTIHASEKEMIENIFEFNDKEVSEIMTHRTNVVSLDVEADFEEVLNIAAEEKYTRIPVYEDNIDNIIGILHIKDLIVIAATGMKQPFCLRDILRPVSFVPDTKPVDALFREMQRDRLQIEVVIDEYGGTAGIVTLEDILEEIVGNLQDEYDEEEVEILKLEDDIYLVGGQTDLDDVATAVNVVMPEDDYDTLGGMIVGLLGRIPDEGEHPELSYRNLLLQVTEMDDRRVSKVRITVIPVPDDDENGTTDRDDDD